MHCNYKLDEQSIINIIKDAVNLLKAKKNSKNQ